MNITSMINETRANGGEVWIFSDIHLLKKGKDSPRIWSRDNVRDTFNQYLDKITEKDMIIFIGDFVDDCIDTNLTKITFVKTFERLNENKNRVWIRGNNDMLPDAFLNNHGWKPCYSATAFIDKYLVFSHTSLDVSSMGIYNIHGHMHRNDNSTMYYYHNPKGCVNIAPSCNLGHGFRLDEIMSMIDAHIWDQYEWYPGEEKPGMSRYICEQATAELDDDYLAEFYGKEKNNDNN